jgi:hypothetical protein
VALPSGSLETTTEDLAAQGCQLVLAERVVVGQLLRLSVTAPLGVGVLEVGGRVVWVSPRSPWRAGIAFSDEDLVAAAKWMDRVRAAVPELFPRNRTPQRVALEAPFYLGPAPRLPDFSDDDLALLRQVGTGRCLCDLRCSSAEELRRLQHRFFALLEQGHLTLAAGRAGDPGSWRRVLGEPSG